jgi:dUTP pyrophosphatase
MKIPKGYEGQVRPRSGLSAKTKIRVANTPGTIDSNYRGEVCILVDNYGSAPFIIKKGDRIAQMVFNKVPTADFVEGEVESEEDNTRGDKGFGSSGVSE